MLPDKPLEEIALCLSGGGYRAAAFHLGSMSYLHRLKKGKTPLLHHVKALSTVSGGTFTGVLYALKTQEGLPFGAIYKEIVEMLDSHDLVTESLELLKDKNFSVSTEKSRNLINAFSLIYDRLLTNGATMDNLTDNQKSHLDLIAFNATEFTYGLNFRFQAEWKEDGTQNKNLSRGSFNFRLSWEEQNEIKLSDIIAASSCFPGGFEPIAFPQDFLHNDASLLQAMKTEEKYRESTGLMDGGIYDNQGIESIQLSEGRRSSRDDGKGTYDLIIISDVSSPEIMDPFEFHSRTQRKIGHYSYAKLKSWFRRWSIGIKYGTLGIGILGLVLGFMHQWENSIWSGIAISLIALCILLLLTIRLAVSWIGKTIGSISDLVKEELPAFYQEKLSQLPLQSYNVHQLEPLLMDRIKSVLLMVKDIFLKQVRRLKYRSVYEDDRYLYRRASNLIKTLTRETWEKINKLKDISDLPDPLKGNYNTVVGTQLQDTAEKAANFGTTLWFTEKDKLSDTIDCLLATGQSTTCYMMMEYLLELQAHPDYNQYPESTLLELQTILDQCLEDWERFREEPRWMVGYD